MSRPSPPSRGGPPPYTPQRRPSTSGSQRPSTSSGEAIEPTSAILRDALREKKGIPQRARSTTPRRVRTSLRSQSYKDEWHQSSDEESVSARRPAQRPPRPRRVSDLGATKGSPGSAPPASRNLGSREADSKIDRLEKENWNLKHRIMLFEERSRLLSDKLEENEADLEDLARLEEKYRDLTEEKDLLRKRLDEAVEENAQLEHNNVELTEINEELVKELETRVQELEVAERDVTARQSAIEEAAGIIQNLEQRVLEIEKEMQAGQVATSTRHDSDYFSGDTIVSAPAAKRLPPLPTSHSVDSDYFSADTSPQVTPKSLKPTPTKDDAKVAVVQQSTMSYNREVGLRSITSKDSLLSGYIESPALPPPTSMAARLIPLRSLRKRTLSSKALRPAAVKSIDPPNNRRNVPQGWSDTRPLRNLYISGELGLQLDTQGIPKPPAAPSDRSSRGSPYSSSPEDDGLGGPMSKSTGSIPASMGRRNSTTARPLAAQPQSMHVRANSTNGRSQPVVARTNTTPLKALPRPSPRRSSTDRPTTTAPRPSSSHQTSGSSRTTPTPVHPLNAHPVHGRFQDSPSSSISSRTTASNLAVGSRPVSYTTPPNQTTSTFSTSKPTTRMTRTPPTPNYALWPRRYPAWPPSAGLLNRDVLFHGDGLDEMFGGTEDGAGKHF